MKHIWISIYSILLLSTMIVSCKPEYEPITNGVYLGETEKVNSKKVIVTDSDITASVFARLGAPVDKDVEVEIGVDSYTLEEYNKKNGTDYVLLPDSCYTLLDTKSNIKAGYISSPLIDLHIYGNKVSSEEKYAIPVKLLAANGMTILNASSSMVILCDKIIHTNVLNTPGGTKMTYEVQEGDELTSNLTRWTVELLVRCNSFSLNKHILSFEDKDNRQSSNLFARFGEFDHPADEIQFKINHKPYYGLKRFARNTWYHVAIVNTGSTVELYQNGELDIVVDNPSPGASYNWNLFIIQTGNPGSLSEVRIWDKVRTQAQIANNMYSVNPKTEGLITYWKINEGEGDVLKDYTGNGRNLATPSRGTWEKQEFPPSME